MSIGKGMLMSVLLAVIFIGVLGTVWLVKNSGDPASSKPAQTTVWLGQVQVDSTSYWVEVQETTRPGSEPWTDVIAKLLRMDANNLPSFISATGITFNGDIRWANVYVVNAEGTACGQFTAASADSPVTSCLNASDDSNLFELSRGTRALATHFLYQGTYAVVPHLNPN